MTELLFTNTSGPSGIIALAAVEFCKCHFIMGKWSSGPVERWLSGPLIH